MDIHIWSDFSCPFCYIGKHNLNEAIKRLDFELQEKIAIYYRSFELNPDAPNYSDKSAVEELAERYGTTTERSTAMARNATTIAREFGLTLDFNKVIPTSTLLGHQLQHYVMQNEPTKSEATAELLFKSYLKDGLNIADKKTILSLASLLALNTDAVEKAINEETYLNQVRDDESIAREMNVESVPFFVVNQEIAIAGSQTIDEFEAFLREQLTSEGDDASVE